MLNFTITMKKVKETKGTIVYGEEGFSPKIPQVYIQKHAFTEGKVPDTITVVVTG
jgi:hypothetical protein